ncbi:hypothetical protein AADC60_08105 [Cytobacillus pseudoceanisediminis]|uniref:Transposase n=1 Tax=Cytobacillus pseudoceanisediminis TaxID=3051614 RepID=A0ABZ2ZS30_9BACI
MAKKGQTFNSYSEEFKHNAVMRYPNGSKSYKVLTEEWGSVTVASLKCGLRNGKMEYRLMSVKESLTF